MKKIRQLGAREITEKYGYLFSMALSVRNNAYAKHSRFLVGCAVETASGKIYTGCNVENQSFGLTICAERSAIVRMVANGSQKIQRICCVLEGGALPGGSPCGACRQVIWEFCQGDPSVEILLADPEGNMRLTTIGYLLPDPFNFT